MKFVTELIGNNNTTCDEMQGGRRQSKIQLVQKESVRSKGRERETKLVIYFCVVVGLCNLQTWQRRWQTDKHDTILNSNTLSHWFYWAELSWASSSAPSKIIELGGSVMGFEAFGCSLLSSLIILVCWFWFVLCNVLLSFSWMDYWTPAPPPSAMHNEADEDAWFLFWRVGNSSSMLFLTI